MSFWDNAGKVFNAAMDVARDKAESIQRQKDHLDRYSDEDLKRIYRTSSGDRRYAAGLILKERGY